MTDRIKGFTVALKENVRIDDAEPLRQAMLQLNGVLDVTPITHEIGDWIVASRLRMELFEKLYDVIFPEMRERNAKLKERT